jgi:hypothetical protein
MCNVLLCEVIMILLLVDDRYSSDSVIKCYRCFTVSFLFLVKFNC